MENTERKEERENLDEKEKLAEAGQQGQKAPEDTVVHVTQLQRKHGGADGGRRSTRTPEEHATGQKLEREVQRVEAGGRKRRKEGVKLFKTAQKQSVDISLY